MVEAERKSHFGRSLLTPVPLRRPLAQIASGGERGRIMLALKIAPVLTATPAAGAAATSAPVDSSFDASAAAANGEDASASDADAGAAPEGSAAAVVRNLSLAPGPPVSIFDEIDAGVSGDVGSSVGRALQRLARTGQQVLCITHLAQVACARKLSVHSCRVITPLVFTNLTSGCSPISSCSARRRAP